MHGITHPAASYHDRDIASVFHPQTNALAHMQVGPHIITGAEGVYLQDEDGGSTLDTCAALWCASLGYTNERLAKVAYDAMCELGYYQLFRHASNKHAIELSERLLSIAPVPMSKVMLQCSGSEANDTALKLVWYYWNAMGKPEKRKVISRMGSYHGSTCAAVSLTGNPSYHVSFGLPFPGFFHTDRPNYYRYAKPGESEEQFAQRLADSLEALILREGPETVGAFWADPVQGNAGALPPPATYFERIQAVLNKYDILMVDDEVICGFGRTGNMWGAQTYGIKPDILVSAKGLSSGMQPVSAVLVNDRVFEVVKNESNRLGAFIHGFTYGGHPVATAVACETLRIYEEMDIVSVVKSKEGLFLEELKKLEDHPLVGSFSGAGLVGGIEIVADKESRKSFAPEAKLSAKMDRHAKLNSVIVRFVPDRIAFSPSFIIREEDIVEMARRTRSALDGVHADLKSEGFV